MTLTLADLPRIVTACARAAGVSVADVMSTSRSATVARARQVAIVIARRCTGASLHELGRALGRDHTTIVSAAQRPLGEHGETILRRAEALLASEMVADALPPPPAPLRRPVRDAGPRRLLKVGARLGDLVMLSVRGTTWTAVCVCGERRVSEAQVLVDAMRRGTKLACKSCIGAAQGGPCRACAGLPHRRQHPKCRLCGEPWEPERLERAVGWEMRE